MDAPVFGLWVKHIENIFGIYIYIWVCFGVRGRPLLALLVLRVPRVCFNA